MEGYQKVYDEILATLNTSENPLFNRILEVTFKLGFKKQFGDKYPSVEEFKKDLTDYASTFNKDVYPTKVTQSN